MWVRAPRKFRETGWQRRSPSSSRRSLRAKPMISALMALVLQGRARARVLRQAVVVVAAAERAAKGQWQQAEGEVAEGEGVQERREQEKQWKWAPGQERAWVREGRVLAQAWSRARDR